MIKQEKTIRYKDIDLTLSSVPSTGDVSVYTDERAITQSIKNLVLTRPYERLFQENIRSQVYSSLFELNTPITRNAIEQSVINVITNYEPRAIVLSVVATNSPDENGYKLTITYIVRTTTRQVTFDFILYRVR